MKYSLGATALFAASVSADLCSLGSTDDGGNWYCQAVKAITYTGVGAPGSYNRVTNMDPNSGACSSEPHGYSGTLAPLDEEVSLHFRGPLNLKQFAVYTPGSSKARRDEPHARRHAHGHGHQHLHQAREAAPEPEVEERALGDNVIATINGKVVSWLNDWSGEATAAPAAPAATTPAAAAAPAASSGNSGSSNAGSSNVGTSQKSSGSSSSSSSSGSTGGWGRQAYYNSQSGTSEGLVFLNHEGGTAGSGTFDYNFGNSLSYAAADGAKGAATPQTLSDKTLASNDEVIIMSDSKCSGSDCGYVRPGTVAHHGFDGPSKAFFFEFGMPSDGKSGTNIYDAVNMPAIWLLNAQIPRTLQYGKPECSCWKTGCGEFDIFEVLASGDHRCKSTLHGNVAGGNSDYFDRPFTGTIKAALLLYKDNIHIKVLDSSFDFGSSVDASVLNDIAQETSVQGPGISLFKLAGALAG